jgi:hypothetical protein
MHAPLDALADELHPPRAPNAEVKAKIRAAAALARMGARTGSKMDLKGLIQASKDLADSLNRFGSAAHSAAAAGAKDGGAGASSLALLDLIKSLDAGKAPTAGSRPSASDVDEAFRALELPAGAQKDVASVITQVARHIDTAVARHKKEAAAIPQLASGLESAPLVSALQRLAEAARSGNKEKLLVTGREIGSYVNQMCAELQKVVARCKDPKMADKINRSLQALKNFSIQLKIVSAVKAASREGDSKDADDQVISVVTSLGNSLSDCLGAVQVAAKTNLLR